MMTLRIDTMRALSWASTEMTTNASMKGWIRARLKASKAILSISNAYPNAGELIKMSWLDTNNKKPVIKGLLKSR